MTIIKMIGMHACLVKAYLVARGKLCGSTKEDTIYTIFTGVVFCVRCLFFSCCFLVIFP